MCNCLLTYWMETDKSLKLTWARVDRLWAEQMAGQTGAVDSKCPESPLCCCQGQSGDTGQTEWLMSQEPPPVEV